ncbi:MAG: enoyl-CoA hydratase-related protein [Methylococcales bacterium]|nr:enoyl-CoA hydratase-related protein [Methylococcales bacterium]
MSYTHFTVSYPETGLALVTLTPVGDAKIFQFSSEKLRELVKLFDDLEAKPELKAVVITGTGNVFAAGADIREMHTITEGKNKVVEGTAFAASGHAAMDRIENSRLFVIAAFNGSAVGGGCETGLACDWRIAVERAKLGQPEINLGLIPGWGASRRLERLVGTARARFMIFTGELISAKTANEWGLVQEVVADDSALIESALNMGRKVLAKSGLILGMCKKATVGGSVLSEKEAQILEQQLFGECFGTADTREGIAAFLEKRTPNFCQ